MKKYCRFFGDLFPIVFFLLAVKPLEVQILSSRQPLSAGRDYDVPCQAVGSKPPANITWWKDNEKLTNATQNVSLSAVGCLCLPSVLRLTLPVSPALSSLYFLLPSLFSSTSRELDLFAATVGQKKTADTTLYRIVGTGKSAVSIEIQIRYTAITKWCVSIKICERKTIF